MKLKEIKSCIYMLRNKVNDKKYIGQTLDVEKRIEGHYKDLSKNKHNKYLQEDFNKYGIDNFEFIVLERITDKTITKNELSILLHHRENYYMDKFKTRIPVYGSEYGYNANYAHKLNLDSINIEESEKNIEVLNLDIDFKKTVMDKENTRELVKHYFLYNPQYNKGFAFKIKAYDTIFNYINALGMTFDEVKDCIESNPACKMPIWEQFYKYYGKMKYKDNDNINKKKIENENSDYRKSINNSTDVNDWL